LPYIKRCSRLATTGPFDLRDRSVLAEVFGGGRGRSDQRVRGQSTTDGPSRRSAKSTKPPPATCRVFGVPTFIVGGSAVFVRLLNRPEGNVDVAKTTIEGVVNLIGDFPELNEFKYTAIPR